MNKDLENKGQLFRPVSALGQTSAQLPKAETDLYIGLERGAIKNRSTLGRLEGGRERKREA